MALEVLSIDLPLLGTTERPDNAPAVVTRGETETPALTSAKGVSAVVSEATQFFYVFESAPGSPYEVFLECVGD